MKKEYKLRDCITMKANINKCIGGWFAYVKCIKKDVEILKVNTMWRLGTITLKDLENKLESFETFKQVKDNLDI